MSAIFTNIRASCKALRYVRIKHCMISKSCVRLLLDSKMFKHQLNEYKCAMKWHILYPIADFENYSLDTLKIADILLYFLRYGKVCLWG